MSEASKIAYQEYPVSLAAGQNYPIYGKNRSLYVDSVVGGSLSVRVDDGPVSTIQQGAGWELNAGESFEKITVINDGPTALTARLVVGSGKLQNRISLSGAVVFSTGANPSTPASVTAGATATPLVAASTTRNAVMIQNQSASENLWVGGANVGNDAAPLGLVVAPKGTLTLATGGALYCRRGAGVDVVATLLEVAS